MICPGCQDEVYVRSDGRLSGHGRRGAKCLASFDKVTRLPTPAERYQLAVKAAQDAYEAYLRRVNATR